MPPFRLYDGTQNPPVRLAHNDFISHARALAFVNRLRGFIFGDIDGVFSVSRYFRGPTRQSAVNFVNNVIIVDEQENDKENEPPLLRPHHVNIPTEPRA